MSSLGSFASIQMDTQQNKIGVWLFLPVCFVVCAAGCGSGSALDTIPVRGSVTFEGKPLTVGEVRYVPTDKKNGRVARGVIQPDGTFELTTLESDDGALAGDYRIVVIVYSKQFESEEAMIAAKEALGARVKDRPPIPARYYRPETSGLTDRVDENHSGYKKIELVH